MKLLILLTIFLIGVALYAVAYAHVEQAGDENARQLQPAAYHAELQPTNSVRVIQPARQDRFYQFSNGWLQGNEPTY